ncbi:hypothetical protein GCM10027614_00770 [Micromonospora vulcania]
MPERAGPLAPVLEGLLRKDPAQRIDATTAERMLRQVIREASGGGPRAGRAEAGTAGVRPDAPVPSVTMLRPSGEPAPASADLPTMAAVGSVGSVDDGGNDAATVSSGDTTAATPTHRTRRRWALGGVAALLVVGLAVGIPLVTHGAADEAGTGPITPGGVPAAADAGQAPVTGTTSTSPSTPQTALTWTTYRDTSGFVLPVPDGWQVNRRDRRVEFREPGGGRVLLVSRTDSPNSNPLAELKAQDKARSTDKHYRGYRRVKLTSVDYHLGGADWEFTYTAGAKQATHVRRRTFRTAKRTGYTIEWSTPEAVWADSEAAFERITSGFRPTTDPSVTPSTQTGATPSAQPSASARTITETWVNDTELTYTGKWSRFPDRPFGDYRNDVTVTTEPGASAQYTFTGTGVAYLSEMKVDMGNLDVYLDGVFQANVSLAKTESRTAQQVAYQTTGLTPGQHTIKIVYKGPSALGMIDALKIFAG